MEPKRTTVLLIEDNAADILLIRKMIERTTGVPFALETARRLAEGFERLDQGDVDLVLLDLGLPDSAGLDTLRATRAHAPDLPIIVLTGRDNEVLGVNAVWTGAQDYLVKGQVDGPLLLRAVRYAIGRHKSQSTVRRRSYVDDRTGLYNQRGFLTLAAQHLKLARRREVGLALILVRLDGVNRIRRIFGPKGVERTLAEAVEVLRHTFRESDVLARVGHDDFAVLAIDAPSASADAAVARLRENARAHKARLGPKSDLSLRIGLAVSDPAADEAPEDLLAKAREALPS